MLLIATWPGPLRLVTLEGHGPDDEHRGGRGGGVGDGVGVEDGVRGSIEARELPLTYLQKLDL
jgi:hypothetical protein